MVDESILILAYEFDEKPSEELKNNIQQKSIELYKLFRSQKHLKLCDSFWDSNACIILILELLNKNNILESDVCDLFTEIEERLRHEILYFETSSLQNYIYYFYLYLIRFEQKITKENLDFILVIQAIERIAEHLENNNFSLYNNDVSGMIYILHLINCLDYFSDYIKKILDSVLQKISKQRSLSTKLNEIYLSNLFIAYKINELYNWNYEINWLDAVYEFLPNFRVDIEYNSISFRKLYFLNTLLHKPNDKIIKSFFRNLENEIKSKSIDDQLCNAIFGLGGIRLSIKTHKKMVSSSWTEILLLPEIL